MWFLLGEISFFMKASVSSFTGKNVFGFENFQAAILPPASF